MSVEIYCGEPPANIALWIRDNVLPAGNPKTVITFANGTIEEYDWSGEINRSTMINAGLFDGNNWIKNPLIVEIGTNVTNIGYDAFLKSGLTSVTIPDSVTNIGDNAFSDCISLTNVTIPNSVTSIGGSAFGNCSGLMNVMIGNGVQTIGGAAFGGCSGLTSVTIPSSVTSIELIAFSDCNALTSVVFRGKTLDQVQGMDFYSWGIDESKISVEP